jgi:hypothetical protein
MAATGEATASAMSLAPNPARDELNICMPAYLEHARAFSATLNPPFTPIASVTLTDLDPSCPIGQWSINRASIWAADRSQRRGLSSRRVNAASHEVTWTFEDAQDAIEFQLTFSG